MAQNWLSDSLNNVQSNGLWGFVQSVYNLYDGVWFSLSSRLPLGHNVFDEEWDVLIVLDACRTDSLIEVSDEYDFIDSVESIPSVGTVTTEWMANTFKNEYDSDIRETAYVCSNPQGKTVFDDRNYPPDPPSPLAFPSWDIVHPSDFLIFDRAWEYGFDTELETIPPDRVTDRIINIARHHKPNRIIAHYTQPHIPFVPEETEVNTYREYHKRDDIDPDKVYDDYLANLRYVLDSVNLLLNNIDAEKVIITADHGDAIGEFGIYGHPGGFFHPVVRNVPWAVTSASDTGNYDPDDPSKRKKVESDTIEMLEKLGYVV